MASAGSLVVTLTTDQSQFVAGMEQAEKKTKEFDAHILTSRKSLGLFAASTGAALGPLRHFTEAFTGGLGIWGAALGTLLAIKEVVNFQTAAFEAAAEGANKFYDAMKSANMETLTKSLEDVDNRLMGLKNGWIMTMASMGEPLWTGMLEQTKGDIAAAQSEADLIRERMFKVKSGEISEHHGDHGGGHANQALSAGQLDVFRQEHSDPNTKYLRIIADNTSKTGRME